MEDHGICICVVHDFVVTLFGPIRITLEQHEDEV